MTQTNTSSQKEPAERVPPVRIKKSVGTHCPEVNPSLVPESLALPTEVLPAEPLFPCAEPPLPAELLPVELLSAELLPESPLALELSIAPESDDTAALVLPSLQAHSKQTQRKTVPIGGCERAIEFLLRWD